MDAGSSIIVTIAITAGGVAVTWGGIMVRLKVLEAKVGRAEAGREKQGERIGKLDERLARWEGKLEALGLSGAYTRKASRSIPITPDESGPAEE